ncbi:MAG: B12-binding domain-containing radical SAM protein [Phycisphaerales bacterium]|nr:MAG: B12-binding domain-containing radical SAM protein [Phycisphaerales bacterium]
MTISLEVSPTTETPSANGDQRRRVRPFNIMLADPPARTDDYDKAYPNLGLLQLISYARDHTPLTDDDIIFLDQFHTIEDHVKLIEEHRPRLYGISFAFLTQRVACETINTLKERFPEMMIIAGGPHPTSAPEEVMHETPVDMVCVGEGELVLADIVNEMIHGGRDFSGIPGLWLRAKDGLFNTGSSRTIKDLDTLPFMAWDRIDFGKFSGQHYCKSHCQSCIVISRGCPHRCAFCSLPVWRAARPFVRLRSPESIAAEVDWLYQLGVREIKIVSDEINVTLPWAKAVCKAIADLGHKDLFFQSNLRADKIDDELADLFKRMNMWLVHLGVESANDRVLNGIEKHITVEQCERCLRLLKKYKVRVLLFMMAFQLWERNGELQYETPRELRRSLWWAWKQFLARRIAYMTWSITTPMPGAPLHDIVSRHGFRYAEQVLDNWNRNKDYLGIDLTSVGISERTKMRYLRAGILSKALFTMFSGNFNWRHNLYRVGILMKSFFGNWGPKETRGRPTVNTPHRAKVEG